MVSCLELRVVGRGMPRDLHKRSWANSGHLALAVICATASSIHCPAASASFRDETDRKRWGGTKFPAFIPSFRGPSFIANPDGAHTLPPPCPAFALPKLEFLWFNRPLLHRPARLIAQNVTLQKGCHVNSPTLLVWCGLRPGPRAQGGPPRRPVSAPSRRVLHHQRRDAALTQRRGRRRHANGFMLNPGQGVHPFLVLSAPKSRLANPERGHSTGVDTGSGVEPVVAVIFSFPNLREAVPAARARD